ncbi:hypothetical protein RJ641_028266, partial [Dillenia turbinata]
RLTKLRSLPTPPLCLMQHSAVDMEERYKKLVLKYRINIDPSPDEMRAYFWREEAIRYTFPERAFCYIAAKSTVAHLRRSTICLDSIFFVSFGYIKRRKLKTLKGKGNLNYSSLAPYVPIHSCERCAARLPAGTGTKQDICILLRDSQYIVEDISDTAISRIVSNALDLLQSEVDPCVHCNGERLRVYLHREK